MVVSVEAGCTKPNAAIFGQAAAALKMPAAAILHVGDSVTNDLEGAQAAGFRALLLDRHQRKNRPGHIQTLGELAEMVSGSEKLS